MASKGKNTTIQKWYIIQDFLTYTQHYYHHDYTTTLLSHCTLTITSSNTTREKTILQLKSQHIINNIPDITTIYRKHPSSSQHWSFFVHIQTKITFQLYWKVVLLTVMYTDTTEDTTTTIIEYDCSSVLYCNVCHHIQASHIVEMITTIPSAWYQKTVSLHIQNFKPMTLQTTTMKLNKNY